MFILRFLLNRKEYDIPGEKSFNDEKKLAISPVKFNRNHTSYLRLKFKQHRFSCK